MRKAKPKSLVHIYTGDGKGKTSAPLGLGVRACGRGFRVLMVQFLKGMETGEMFSLRKLQPSFKLQRGKMPAKFTWEMNESQLAETAAVQQELLSFAVTSASSGECDMLIMDEIMAAIAAGFVRLDAVTAFLRDRPEGVEVVMTGRNAPEELIELADYVSDIKAVKHPADKGMKARRGIEF